MNARTIIITVGAVAALAAPGLANARMLPAKHTAKHVVKPIIKKPSTGRAPLYLYYPAPALTMSAADQAAAATSDSTADASMTDDSDDC
jgi:hypothetical protein